MYTFTVYVMNIFTYTVDIIVLENPTIILWIITNFYFSITWKGNNIPIFFLFKNSSTKEFFIRFSTYLSNIKLN